MALYAFSSPQPLIYYDHHQTKTITEILAALEGYGRVFLIGCAKCATVCKSGGEEEIWQMQEQLTASGKEVTGSIIIDEVCHMLRAGRDLRGRKEMVGEADALLVLACGAGVQSVSSANEKRTIAGLDTLFLAISVASASSSRNAPSAANVS